MVSVDRFVCCPLAKIWVQTIILSYIDISNVIPDQKIYEKFSDTFDARYRYWVDRYDETAAL